MLTPLELQESLDRWNKNYPETMKEVEEEMKNRKPRGIQTEEEFNEIMKELDELRKIADYIAIKYGLRK